jgi:hypothetical protein
MDDSRLCATPRTGRLDFTLTFPMRVKLHTPTLAEDLTRGPAVVVVSAVLQQRTAHPHHPVLATRT